MKTAICIHTSQLYVIIVTVLALPFSQGTKPPKQLKFFQTQSFLFFFVVIVALHQKLTGKNKLQTFLKGK